MEELSKSIPAESLASIADGDRTDVVLTIRKDVAGALILACWRLAFQEMIELVSPSLGGPMLLSWLMSQ